MEFNAWLEKRATSTAFIQVIHPNWMHRATSRTHLLADSKVSRTNFSQVSTQRTFRRFLLSASKMDPLCIRPIPNWCKYMLLLKLFTFYIKIIWYRRLHFFSSWLSSLNLFLALSSPSLPPIFSASYFDKLRGTGERGHMITATIFIQY